MANKSKTQNAATALILATALFWNASATAQDTQTPEIDALLDHEGAIKSLFDCLAIFYAYDDSRPDLDGNKIGVGFSNVDFGDFMGEQTQQALENSGLDTMDDAILNQLETRLNTRLEVLAESFANMPEGMPMPLSSDNLKIAPDEIIALDSQYRACIIIVLEKMNNPIVPLDE